MCIRDSHPLAARLAEAALQIFHNALKGVVVHLSLIHISPSRQISAFARVYAPMPQKFVLLFRFFLIPVSYTHLLVDGKDLKLTWHIAYESPFSRNPVNANCCNI